MKDRLIELLDECRGIEGIGMELVAKKADFLLENGVIVPPVKVKQTVWVYNQTAGKVYQNTVIGIYAVGTSRYKNSIKCEYINIHGESSRRKFTWAQIGKQVFLTKDEAEKALAMMKGGAE